MQLHHLERRCLLESVGAPHNERRGAPDTRMGESHMRLPMCVCIILHNRRPIVWVWCRQNVRKMRVKRRAFIQRRSTLVDAAGR